MDDHEKPIFDALLQMLEQIDPWLAVLAPDGPRPSPQPGSALVGDNNATDPFHLSHAAWFALSTAVDHLHAHRTMLRDARTIHMFAPYSLLRGAFENAAAAVWLLGPPNRDERVLRRVRHHAGNIKNAERLNELVGLADEMKQESRRQQLAAIAARRGFGRAQALKPVSYSEIVSWAGGHNGMGERLARLIWGLCSGTAHGDFWSLTALAGRVELPGAPPGIAHLHVTGDVGKLFYLTFFTVSMAMHGWRLFDLRSASPFPV
jgi:hypothetical protein